MLKSEKEEMIKELHEKFSRTKSAVVAEFSKVDVETVTKLRRKFREGNVEYKVIKNTLARRAAQGTDVAVIADDFTGPVALCISYGDVVAPAKILTEFTKDLEDKIKIRSAVVDGRKVDAAGVKQLAKLPGLNELRAQLLGMITQPATKLVRTIAAPGTQLARVIQAHADKSQG
ncbi:50S ribosomal protein L10 [Myxococcus sp. CA051A]|uniref:Large ribosomal subunit protein uL10 n=1 Tax=Myxococcus llanfairpwllgwyngyllgogerychwyrndrobwllllantysiliogogogochensis TaxID=2590453 RepID=A0A540X372_9BACT|nr:50S ribosomal protein L10 [Myxococcus llanfairpwllgwyngyllgogerychwyrndrobwllllantysiliogogogochensis]NTX03560.1 50S ribosomal protein L10 [Myxococcus sp. CA040A]NTX41252.1 50S ribosomal protein L10 [Myxococcus sp. CA033]NTX54960.1 50S ribosomal protein L10 [Myxococcus sp. CA039A]NTX67101.1 50S ribosomal protein L10 [Myxococcus sp. CA051A]TQF15663.1 50S ribosomal protein L10 [Myxococcus llanfairpwllgwyngyllgogerychwyrndrobwllllantysiliogogogochensis]